jgi:hypothetical protein
VWPGPEHTIAEFNSENTMRGRPVRIAHTVFGKDAQIIRLGCFLVEHHLRAQDPDGYIPFARGPVEIKSAIRTIWPTLRSAVEALEVFRRRPVTDEELDRVKYEAVFSATQYRGTIGHNGQLKRIYGPEISIAGRNDRERVKAAENDRRRGLEKKIASECAVLIIPDDQKKHLGRRRTISYKMLLELDFAEIDLRRACGFCSRSQQIVSKLVADLEVFLLYELLKIPTNNDRPGAEVFDDIISAAFERIQNPDAPDRTIRFYKLDPHIDDVEIEVTDKEALGEYLAMHSQEFKAILSNLSLRMLLSGKKVARARLIEKNIF